MLSISSIPSSNDNYVISAQADILDYLLPFSILRIFQYNIMEDENQSNNIKYYFTLSDTNQFNTAQCYFNSKSP